MSEKITLDIEVLEEIIFGRVDPKIYAFMTETIPNYLKVGDTYRPLEIRLYEWRKYFPNLEKKFEAIAKVDEDTFFRDYAIHHFLLNDKNRPRLAPDDIKDIPYYSKEFFKDATEDDLNDAIIDIKNCHDNNETKYQFYKFEESHIPITHTYTRTATYEPRPNQQQTVDNFKNALANNRTNLLMYAVMRFGKSFTSMCCAVEMDARFVVVVSAKADVKSEWKKTVESHVKFDGYYFLDTQSLSQSTTILSKSFNEDKKIVLFLTLQDLQGEDLKSKHNEVFTNQIDLLLIDESHFGARASEYGKVLKDSGLNKKEIKSEQKQSEDTFDDLEELDSTIKEFNAKIRIHLSGTPYRILMESEFTGDDIIAFYQFTDIAQDQEAWDIKNLKENEPKNEWDNPYYGFPKMIRFAFNPNKASRVKMEEMKKNGVTYTFSELFRPHSITKDKNNSLHKKFRYEDEIIDLLKVIDGSEDDEELLSFLDYEKIKDGQMCRHLVCVLPYRASCDALEELISSNEFKNLNSYEIINISGVENEKIYRKIEEVQNKINKCEEENKKTITLTVNKMLTGSTVPQWDTMLYFKDTSSPQEYDQAIFRLQNQYIKTYKDSNGNKIKYNMKPQTLLVDFNPDRMFLIQEQKSQIYNVNTDLAGNSQLEERIKKELEVSPIITLNKNKMVKIVPSDILDAVRQYTTTRSVFDEATTISIDYALLNIEEIKAVIEKQGKISSRQGLEIEATQDEGTDMEVEDGSNDDTENRPTVEKENIEDYKGQFAMYYARILFFAFLTDSQIKSMQEMIDSIDNNHDNIRILSNISLDLKVLKLFQEHVNPFILRELDYKIQNINSLANDTTLEPKSRASNALKKFSRLSDSEIITPENVTDMIVNTLPTSAFNPSQRLIDIASKQGEFVYAVYKKYGRSIANNFYSIPTSKIAYEFTRKVYQLLELNINNIERNYTSYELIKENELIIEEELNINGSNMRFDTIIGNPPYQQSDGGARASAKPIYHNFVNLAKSLNPNYISMIMPTRWYAGGKGLDEFRNQMLDDNHISQLHDFLKPDLIFPNINLRGGICYFLWNHNHDINNRLTNVYTYTNNLLPKVNHRTLRTDGSDILIRHSIAVLIINKVKDSTNFKSFEKDISARKPFGLEANIIKNKTLFKTTNRGIKNSVKCYGKNKQIGYLKKDEVSKNSEWIDRYKVFTPRANNIGTELNDDNLNTFIGEPNTICTESYIVIGINLNLDITSASNLCKYFKTKFARFQHSVGKASQDATSKTYKFIPLQDFTANSDINWTQSIEEIDKQLYTKYNLNTEEINFVEEMIKPMN